MNRLYLFILAALLTTTVAMARGRRQVVILHTNDTHSCIFPLNPNLADTAQANRGGYLRRMAMVNEQRRQQPDLLLFDSGDFSQGSPYYTMFKGDVEVELMNQMGYDAATIGNHEFDYGLDNMVRLFRKARFPIVCSNYDFSGTELDGLVKPYITLRRQGVKIGVFGLAPKLEGLVFTKNYGPIRYLDACEVAQQMSDLLRKQEKCDLVICLSHLGWAVTDPCDEQVIERTTGIDVVLGGHSHTYLEKLEWVNDRQGRAVAVDQNGKSGIYVGRLVLSVGKK